MSNARSPFRRVIAGVSIAALAVVAVVATASVAAAAPGAPTITSPVNDATFTATTISVSGSLVDFLSQEVTVRVDNNGSITTGCTVEVVYTDNTFTCDVTVLGPGVYTLTATSVDLIDPELVPSPVSDPVTVTVGNDDPVTITNYPEFDNAWTTRTPTLEGVGPALGSIQVFIFYGASGSATYCTVAEVPVSGVWSCTGSDAGPWGYGPTSFRADGFDVTGAQTPPDVGDFLVGEMVAPPPQTSVSVSPASVSLQAEGVDGSFVSSLFYSVEVPEGDAYVYGAPVDSCAPGEDSSILSCTFSGLAPGIWNFHTEQDVAETYLSSADDYILIPDAPGSFAATVNANRSVTFSGTGTAGNSITVLGPGDNAVCAVTLGVGPSWQCTVSPAAGTAGYRAIQQSVGFVADPPADFGVLGSYDGISAATGSISVTVPPAPAAPLPASPPVALAAPTPLPWVLEGYDGSPLTPGQALSLSATGLPVGTVVVVEIRSTPQVLGTAAVGDTGIFALDVVVPDDLEPGLHTLVATATPPGGVASIVSIPVTVVAAVAPVSNDDTAEESETGAESAVPISDGTVGGEVDRGQLASPSAISDSIPTIDRIFRQPLLIIASAGLALALLLLVAFPAELLNSTLASNTRRIGRWYDAVERATERTTEWFAAVTRTRALAAALLVVLTSLIFGFIDPNYGFDLVSVRMTISLAIGLFIVTYVASWISGAIITRVWNIETRVSLQPAALVFAVIGVIVARLLEFSPGFLIGLVIGLDLITRVGAAHRVRAILTNIGVIVGVSVLAWVGFSIMTALSSGEPNAVDLLISDALIATTAEGLTAALAALLPLGFLDGHEVFRRSKLLWAGSFATVGTIFALIVLPTAAGEDGAVADVGFWMLIMVIFAAVTLALWALLHFTGGGRGDDDGADDDASAGQRAVAAR